MDKLVVEGGARLSGSVQISGAKNAVLPILAATLLADRQCVISNVPNLKDVRTLTEILREVGLEVDQRAPGTIVTRVVDESNSTARYELVSTMRASIYLLGPLLAKRGYAKVSLPGGCVFGLRPVDLHIKGLRALGAEIELEHGYIVAKAPKGRLRGGYVYLAGPMGSSVGATANTLMAACLADGKTVIEGAACEPEVTDLALFLNRMGATIEGIGTPTLKITGVPSMRGGATRVCPDRIEAGTYMAMAAMTGGDVRLHDVRPDHMGAQIDVLRQMGVSIEDEGQGVLRVKRDGPLQPTRISMLPYPCFPTDMQAQLVSLLTVTPGMSVVTERIYPERFGHCAELSRMGAQIHREGPSAIICGVPELSGAEVMASDLRAGAALVAAGLIAKGTTTVHRVYHIDRGYEAIEQKLTNLGATIHRLSSTPSETIKRAA